MSGHKARMCSKEAAAYLGLHPSTLAKLRMSGEGPEFQKAGRKVLYHPAALEAWLQGRTYNSTSQYT